MYVEISGRRSGKTTRLAKAVVKALKEGYTAYVICPQDNMCHNAESGIRRCMHDDPWFEGKTLDSLNLVIIPARANMRGCLLDDKSRVFYDEFDMIQHSNMEDNGVSNFVISETGYYVTSPRYVRRYMDIVEPVCTDLLIKVLAKSKGHYMHYQQVPGGHRQSEFGYLPMEETGQWCSL